MKRFLMSLIVLSSVASFANPHQIICKPVFNDGFASELTISEGLPGEGGAGVKIAWKESRKNKKGEVVVSEKSKHLAWAGANTDKQNENKTLMTYSNNAYGKQAHDEKNPMYTLNLLDTYDQTGNQILERAAILTLTAHEKDTSVKSLRSYSETTLYTCN